MKWLKKAPGKEKRRVPRKETFRNIGNVGQFSYKFLIPEEKRKKKKNMNDV